MSLFNRALFFLVVCLTLLSCSSSVSKRDSWVSDGELISDCTISEAAKSGMAVVFNTRLKNKELFGDPYLGWPLANRKPVLEELRKSAKSVVEIPDLALQKVAINPVDEEEVVASYNQAAVDAGANYLLLMHAAGGIETERNFFSILYLTIIGAFIFPGSEGIGQASLQAFLYKAGNPKPCLTIETGGSSTQYRPYFFFDDKSLYMEARDNAFKQLLPLLK